MLAASFYPNATNADQNKLTHQCRMNKMYLGSYSITIQFETTLKMMVLSKM
jgi:hypothetical protein